MECFAKRNNALLQVCNQNFFRARAEEGLWSYGTLINISVKTKEKEALQGNILEFFLLLIKLEI